MDEATSRALLERLEARPADELTVPLAFLAGQSIAFGDGELNGARRRAMLLLAAGGDPREGLALDGRAVTSLAAELDGPERRASLAGALRALRSSASGLPAIGPALDRLLDDEELAWRSFACALLADEL